MGLIERSFIKSVNDTCFINDIFYKRYTPLLMEKRFLLLCNHAAQKR
jgi:hypothetical protein